MMITNNVLVHDLGDMVKLHNLNMASVHRRISSVDSKYAFLGMAMIFTVMVFDKKIKKLESKIEKLDKKIEEVAEHTVYNAD